MAREMKDSGIEWIGAIPIDWTVSRLQWSLKEIVEQNNPIQTTQVLSLTNKMGVIPYEEKGNQGNKAKENYEEYHLAYKDTLVVNSMNVLIGSVGISQYYGCVSPVYYVFKNTDISDLRFINYIFQNIGFQKELRKYANGILEIRMRISTHDMMRRMIPFPALCVQKKIADYLDAECARIDTVMEQTRASIEEYKKLKQAVITQAVTKGIRPNRPMKDSGVDWIENIPSDWQLSKIKHVCTFQPWCDITLINEDTIITYTPMDCIKNGYYINNTAPYGKVSSSLTSYSEGDIVMAKVTPCFENGNIAIMENLAAGFGLGSSELFVFRPRTIDRRFLFYWLRNDRFIQRACSTMTGTGGLKRVSPYFMENCDISLPPADEQKEIVAYLDEKIPEIDALVDKKEKLISELESYKKSMIYEYVTGKKEVAQ